MDIGLKILTIGGVLIGLNLFLAVMGIDTHGRG